MKNFDHKEPVVEQQLIRPNATVTVQMEPSERVLDRMEKAATLGAAFGAAVSILLVFLVLRQSR